MECYSNRVAEVEEHSDLTTKGIPTARWYYLPTVAFDDRLLGT